MLTLNFRFFPGLRSAHFSLTLCVEEPVLTCQMTVCPLECDSARDLRSMTPSFVPHGAITAVLWTLLTVSCSRDNAG